MSQSTAVRAVPRPNSRHAVRTAPPPPRLRVVSAPAQHRSRAGLVFACATLLTGGLVGLLLLNVNLERGAYVLQAQQARLVQLQEQQQALQENLSTLQAPQNLAAAAAQLGMVRDPNAAFIRGSDGKVLGVPQQAVADPTHSVATTTPAPTAAAQAGGAGTAIPAPTPSRH